ncbi:MAG TPA: lipocalin-like domain-containing protein [Gaiellaceae bacterium]|nr:lipocalin-like domain-containing protein [Gaiellaceae bacterium]
MIRIAKLGIAALAFSVLAAGALMPSAAEAAAKLSKSKLVGTWIAVSISNTTPDGKTTQTYGPGDGVLIFGRNGTFVQVLARADLPKFASNNRMTGTADENKAVVQGTLSIFGTYKTAKDGTVTLHIERGSYANWNGTDQTRVVTSLTASEFKWDIAAPSVGGSASAAWKRSK